MIWGGISLGDYWSFLIYGLAALEVPQGASNLSRVGLTLGLVSLDKRSLGVPLAKEWPGHRETDPNIGVSRKCRCLFEQQATGFPSRNGRFRPLRRLSSGTPRGASQIGANKPFYWAISSWE